MVIAPDACLVNRFATALHANAGTCHGPYTPERAAAIAANVAVERSAGQPVALAIGDPLVHASDLDTRLERLGAPVLLLGDRPAAAIASAGTGVTGAVRGLAATGTVGVACGPGAPRCVSLLPSAHVCLLRVADLVEDLSAALAFLTDLPSALTWISGPSRSADLELRITLGVHGPASLDVVLIAAKGEPNGQRAVP